MSLLIYIDDSGKSDPPVFVLGGWALSSEKLVEFEADWSAVLSRPPAIAYFKMKEAHARRGAFKGMSQTDRDAKVAGLAEVLGRYAVASISGVVEHEVYRRVFEGQMMRWMDQPYQIMFHLMIACAFKLRNRLGLGSLISGACYVVKS